MRIFYDCEFIEDGRTIDLISIGMVAENGNACYYQNAECRFKRASVWVKANVFPHLTYFDQKRLQPDNGYDAPPAAHSVWFTRNAMAQQLIRFVHAEEYGKPELWGYYSAYDHVALCQLFGTMMDLPTGWPMYTHDLKQWCDELGNPRLPEQGKGEHNALADARWNREAWLFLNELAVERKAE